MRYIPTYLVVLSHITNRLTCGSKGYSLCARFYSWKRSGFFFGYVLVGITDRIFYWDKQHCRKAFYMRAK